MKKPKQTNVDSFDSNDIEQLKMIPIEKGSLRVFPLGGLGEIGMNCMILESSKEIIVIDCGVLFSDLDDFGIELVIPKFDYLLSRREKIKALIMTHGHEDHIGALPYLLKTGISAPVYCSSFTSLMLREKLNEFGVLQKTELRVFKPGEKYQTEDFKFEPVSVNHSIVDAMALLIDTPAGRVIHTGDFKVDKSPYFGNEMDPKIFQKAGEEGVLLLMSDSTNVERCEHSESEKQVFYSFEKLFASAQGLTVIAMFSSNIARVAQVFELARKQNKKIALSGRSMIKNYELAIESGHIKDTAGQIIGLDQIENHQRKDVIVLTTGTQGEPRSALVRISKGEHAQIDLQENDRVLMSSRFIPGNEKSVGRMINHLFKQGGEVLYEATHQIHVSGHATRPELKQMIEWTKPKFFLPIHGEYRHLVHHAKLAEETGLKREQILVASNGDVLDVSPNHFECVYKLEEETKRFIDGPLANEITKDILRDRRKLAETGAVFVLMTQDQEYLNIIAGPEVVLRGVTTPENEDELVLKIRKEVALIVKETIRQANQGNLKIDLKEEIRVQIRKLVFGLIGKKPVVIPFIMEL